jgi:hypothetical protein
VTLIGVKSKYGSGWGTSPGIINFNYTQKTILGQKDIYLIYIVV